ncbi:MAG: AAA family ATPase, partial [Bdellovibrionales bacterium]|nr:AAA family ATPase [Bdellovibrionales bacterium]
MQVSRIEIFGFKSFMDRLVLPLDVGVTGVVGPNGCGKSNIVDALRWVLGESRAKSLRGGLLEDVIFNGTDKLRPLGLAEVTLTLRAQEDNFFAELNSQELEAEALVEQAEAELENSEAPEDGEEPEEKQAVQADDEEPSDDNSEQVEAEHTPHLRVIEGNLDKAESEEPTQSLSEKIEAVNKSDTSVTLVNRFSWLKAATEVQVTRRLYRSGESEFFINRVPCRLKDIKELFRAVGLGARTHTIVAQGEVSRVVTAKSDERRRILEEAAGVQGFREKITGAERRLSETAQNMARIEDIIKEVSRQVNSLKRQASRARNRQQLKDTLKENEIMLFKDSFARAERSHLEQEKLFQEATNEEQQAESKLRVDLAEEEQSRAQLLEADVQADEVRSVIDNLKEELANRARQRVQRQERLAELKAFAIAKETEIKRLEERERQLLERQAEGKKIIDSILTEEKQLALKLEEHDEALGERIQELERELKSLREQMHEKETFGRSNRDKLISSQSRLESLQEQIRAASPLTTLQELERHGNQASAVAGLKGAKMLIQELEVPEQYLRAIQAVLAERASYLVVENPHQTGTALLQALKNVAREDSFGIGLFNRGVAKVSLAPAPEHFKSLLSLIQFNDEIEAVVSSLLANVYFVEQLEDAIDFFEGNADSDITLVTATGDVLTKNSLYCFRSDSGLVSITKEVQELERICAERKAEQDRIEHELTDFRADKVLLEERLVQTRKAYQEQQRR